MISKPRIALVCCITAGVAAAASIAVAQSSKETKPAPAGAGGQASQPQLPPGMSEADMKACVEAGTPGPMHKYLAESIGVWQGKCKSWMAPGTEATVSECTSTITPMMDGRYIRCEMAGDMPGMGPFSGFGINGFDNVAQKFQSTWVDNHSTGIMFGTGELSSDRTTITWNYAFNCPLTKKPTVMREVDRRTGKDSMVLEMYGPDPKTNKEFKMMEIAFTRKAGTAPASTR